MPKGRSTLVTGGARPDLGEPPHRVEAVLRSGISSCSGSSFIVEDPSPCFWIRAR